MISETTDHPRSTLKQLFNRLENFLGKILRWLLEDAIWEKALLLTLIIIIPLLTFYNLGLNPRSWHDEGASLSVARTLAEDGIYAMRNSDGYQTYGPIQSVGPTVLVPVALSFKILGIGLFQARIVAAIYLLITVLVFYFAGRSILGSRVALIATWFLVSSPAVRLFLYGRQVLGEIPALGFFLAGFWLWARANKTSSQASVLFSGLLFGVAMVTKSQYLVIMAVTVILMVILDLWYYRQGTYKSLLVVSVVAFSCFAAWQGWQVIYYGINTYMENATKLKELAAVSTGFHIEMVINGLRSTFGSTTGNFYLYWGFVGIIYAGFFCSRKDKQSQVLSFLVFFSCIWLAYYIFWSIPWQRYALVPMAIILFFIAKLFTDLINGFTESSHGFIDELRQLNKQKTFLSVQSLMSLGTLVALVSFGLWMGYKFQSQARSDVVDKVGWEVANMYTPAQLKNPYNMATFLNKYIPTNAIIETWERELVIFSNHNYHFPDQSLLTKADEAIYFDGSTDYQLGSAYFSKVQPDYVIVGFYSRYNEIYNTIFLNQHYELLKTIGSDDWRYDIYSRIK